MPPRRKASVKIPKDHAKEEEEQRQRVQRSWRKRGGLENMPNMPLDILIEVRDSLCTISISLTF